MENVYNFVIPNDVYGLWQWLQRESFNRKLCNADRQKTKTITKNDCRVVGGCDQFQ